MKPTLQRLIAAAAVALTAGLAATAHAQPVRHHGADHRQDARIEQRQAQQQQRIRAAFERGALTRHEYAQLQRQQGHIAQVASRAWADGRLSPFERQQIEGLQDRASRDIARESHDARFRG